MTYTNSVVLEFRFVAPLPFFTYPSVPKPLGVKIGKNALELQRFLESTAIYAVPREDERLNLFVRVGDLVNENLFANAPKGAPTLADALAPMLKRFPSLATHVAPPTSDNVLDVVKRNHTCKRCGIFLNSCAELNDAFSYGEPEAAEKFFCEKDVLAETFKGINLKNGAESTATRKEFMMKAIEEFKRFQAEPELRLDELDAKEADAILEYLNG